MTSLAEELELEAVGEHHVCIVARILEELGQECEADRATLADALHDLTIPAIRLERVLRARGYAVGDVSIGRHRRGVCACRH